MEMLDFLREKVKKDTQRSHPFAAEDMQFKYAYAFGLAAMSYGHMKSLAETEKYFNTILMDLHMPEGMCGRLITDINDNFDYKIGDVVTKVETKERKYCFILDLYRIYDKTLWSEDFCREILQLYLMVFRLSKEEKDFLEQFSRAARKKKNEDAKKVYYTLQSYGYNFSYHNALYYFPEFHLEEEYENIVVETGKTLCLDKHVKIAGNIRVEKGATLIIQHSDLQISGSIQVDGGRVSIKDSKIKVVSCMNPVFLDIKHTSFTEILDSQIDCSMQCGFVLQNVGQLEIRRTWIGNTNKSSAITFKGVRCKLRQVVMEACHMGAVSIYDLASLSMRDCVCKSCENEYGGGVYSETAGNVKIIDSSFEMCKAKYLGAAVYFKYLKFGQYMRNCSFTNCIPEDSEKWGTYEDDMDLREFWRITKGVGI